MKLLLAFIFGLVIMAQPAKSQLAVTCSIDFTTCSISTGVTPAVGTAYVYLFTTSTQVLGVFSFGSTLPSTCNENDMYFHTKILNLSVCHGGSWNAIAPTLMFVNAPIPVPTPTPLPTVFSGYIAPMGFGVGAVNIWASEPPSNRFIVDQFVAQFSGTFTRVSLPTGVALPANKALLYGIYDAGCMTLLGTARGVALPTNAHELLFDKPVALVAGTVYNQAFSSEIEIAPFGLVANSGAGVQNALYSSTTNGHYVAKNLLTGIGATYAFPASCGGGNGFSYYGVVTPVLRP